MFVTIRAKLIGLSFLSLLFTALVGGFGYYSNVELADALAGAHGRQEGLNVQGNLGQDAVRADVLQLLRVSRNADDAAFKAASDDLNGHLKALMGNIANTGLSEKTRQAAAIVKADVNAFAKSAQSIAALAQTDILSAEAQFNVFNEAYKKLNADQLKLNGLIASEMAESGKAADAVVMDSGNNILVVLAAAIILFTLFANNIYRRIMKPLNQLRQAISKVEGGHYDVRVNLHTQDEIGSLSRAFDKLIEDRISALKSTATENERINNSVIGLFGAMGALALRNGGEHLARRGSRP